MHRNTEIIEWRELILKLAYDVSLKPKVLKKINYNWPNRNIMCSRYYVLWFHFNIIKRPTNTKRGASKLLKEIRKNFLYHLFGYLKTISRPLKMKSPFNPMLVSALYLIWCERQWEPQNEVGILLAKITSSILAENLLILN